MNFNDEELRGEKKAKIKDKTMFYDKISSSVLLYTQTKLNLKITMYLYKQT